jgi:hypothetical protein
MDDQMVFLRTASMSHWMAVAGASLNSVTKWSFAVEAFPFQKTGPEVLKTVGLLDDHTWFPMCQDQWTFDQLVTQIEAVGELTVMRWLAPAISLSHLRASVTT